MTWLRSFAALSAPALLLQGCATTGGPRDSFESWRQAIVRGDFQTMYGQMSPTFRSHWIFLIFLPDPKTGEYSDLAKEYYKKLGDGQVKEFEAWLTHSKNAYPLTRRVSELSDTILSSAWTFELLERYFRLVHPHIKVEFGAMEISEGGEPDTAENLFTLIVRNIRGSTELYELVLLEGKWKVHYHRAGPQ